MSLCFKLRELQKKEAERKQLIEQASIMAQKIVSSKIGKQQYIESNQTNHAKRDRITEDMVAIIATL